MPHSQEVSDIGVEMAALRSAKSDDLDEKLPSCSSSEESTSPLLGKVAANGSKADGATFLNWKRAKKVDAADILHHKANIFSPQTSDFV